jgi:hypothetical protein
LPIATANVSIPVALTNRLACSGSVFAGWECVLIASGWSVEEPENQWSSDSTSAPVLVAYCTTSLVPRMMSSVDKE